MTYRRYDGIKFSGYLFYFVIIFGFVGISLIAFIKCMYVEGFLFLIATILSLLNVLGPYLECYSICDNIITAQRPFRTARIIIPHKTVVVITQADIHPKFGHQSFLIKDRLAITILQEMSLDSALELLHGKYPTQSIYTNSTIERTIDEYRFVYSFVFTKELLEQILQSTNCLIIVPVSIKHKVIIEYPSVEVYIDAGY